MIFFWSVLISGLSLFAGSGLALGAALGLTGLLLLHFVAGGITFVAVDAVWNVLNSFTLMSLCNLPVHFYPRTVFEMLYHTFLWMWVQKLRTHKWRHQHKIRQNGGRPLLFAASA